MTNKFHQFVARVKDTGLAKSAHFYVEITPPRFMETSHYDMETVNLYCQQAQIPEMVLNTTQINDDGLERHVVVDKKYGRATFVFVCDQDMLVRKFFEDWIQNVVVSKGGVLAYPSEYTVDTITVHQVNMAREVVYSNSMHDCFPIVLGDLPLSTESHGLHLVQVQFVYRYWDSTAFLTDNLSNVPDDIRNFISSQRTNTNLPPMVPQLAKLNSNMDRANMTQVTGPNIVGVNGQTFNNNF
jgi:hypothetical protein